MPVTLLKDSLTSYWTAAPGVGRTYSLIGWLPILCAFLEVNQDTKQKLRRQRTWLYSFSYRSVTWSQTWIPEMGSDWSWGSMWLQPDLSVSSHVHGTTGGRNHDGGSELSHLIFYLGWYQEALWCWHVNSSYWVSVFQDSGMCSCLNL